MTELPSRKHQTIDRFVIEKVVKMLEIRDILIRMVKLIKTSDYHHIEYVKRYLTLALRLLVENNSTDFQYPNLLGKWIDIEEMFESRFGEPFNSKNEHVRG